MTTEEFTVALRARLNLDVPRAHVSAIEVAVEPELVVDDDEDVLPEGAIW